MRVLPFVLPVLVVSCSDSPVRRSAADDAGRMAPPAAWAHSGPRDGSGESASRPGEQCSAEELLDGLPAGMPEWSEVGEPVRAGETIGGRLIGFVGRVFRKGRICVLVAASRPERVESLAAELAKIDDMEGDPSGNGAMTRSSPEANQVTTWLRIGDRLLMLRAFGTTDAAALAPFLSATPANATADAGCPPLPLVESLDDEDALFGPPGSCTMP